MLTGLGESYSLKKWWSWMKAKGWLGVSPTFISVLGKSVSNYYLKFAAIDNCN